ncbi:hypothetical protein [Caballeronia sp. GAWG1-1]|uniref:hypothetical protein n=1 Tax=Caballeronia sp. GAWG1-1 TaxID=2921742 RepID=UPI002028F7D8|nr:hypothetical protein [Caballeronia sp. GAWG1-1]
MSALDSNLSQATILARMSATRAELIAANHVNTLIASSRLGVRAPVIQEGPLFLQSPYAGLIAGALIATTILGPAQLVRIVALRGLTPWITRTIRSLAGR